MVKPFLVCHIPNLAFNKKALISFSYDLIQPGKNSKSRTGLVVSVHHTTCCKMPVSNALFLNCTQNTKVLTGVCSKLKAGKKMNALVWKWNCNRVADAAGLTFLTSVLILGFLKWKRHYSHDWTVPKLGSHYLFITSARQTQHISSNVCELLSNNMKWLKFPRQVNYNHKIIAHKQEQWPGTLWGWVSKKSMPAA